ncbi:hypothetical protein [Mycobacteroides abscessus]|uniref:hypothetical protein n=1 Tax=Mycobacteroides abscessus TaxID=36809 RepID=UPI0007F97ED7|nr:hypothetical protein [Mycobacteroides abscessus]ANN98171.1 hypothetical protein BAB74_05005 [Mycobacteroides abscessus]
MTTHAVGSPTKPRNLVGTGVAARIAGVTQETMRRWHRNPDYRGPRPFQHGGRLQWDADEIRAYIEESRQH